MISGEVSVVDVFFVGVSARVGVVDVHFGFAASVHVGVVDVLFVGSSAKSQRVRVRDLASPPALEGCGRRGGVSYLEAERLRYRRSR